MRRTGDFLQKKQETERFLFLPARSYLQSLVEFDFFERVEQLFALEERCWFVCGVPCSLPYSSFVAFLLVLVSRALLFLEVLSLDVFLISSPLSKSSVDIFDLFINIFRNSLLPERNFRLCGSPCGSRCILQLKRRNRNFPRSYR